MYMRWFDHPYLKNYCITNSSRAIVPIIAFFNQPWKQVVEIHVPDLLVYVDRISNWMQNLCQGVKGCENQREYQQQH